MPPEVDPESEVEVEVEAEPEDDEGDDDEGCVIEAVLIEHNGDADDRVWKETLAATSQQADREMIDICLKGLGILLVVPANGVAQADEWRLVRAPESLAGKLEELAAELAEAAIFTLRRRREQ